jgi:hypothetical protein
VLKRKMFLSFYSTLKTPYKFTDKDQKFKHPSLGSAGMLAKCQDGV